MSETTHFFEGLDYFEHSKKHQLDILLGVDTEKYGSLEEKPKNRGIYGAVENNTGTPLSPVMDDLIRLHYLAISRKVTTILEFGVGNSTLIFGDALDHNKRKHGSYVKDNLRRSNPFEVHSIDSEKKWIDVFKKENKVPNNVNLMFAECKMATFGDRVCTLYKKLPNICPDLIYLDAPNQFSVLGEINGITTAHPDKVPMAADILLIEHFLLPGTLIVVDGRTANARFLRSNFQRNWDYKYSRAYDQHFFELKESPLGELNRRQIEFCLGEDWLVSID